MRKLNKTNQIKEEAEQVSDTLIKRIFTKTLFLIILFISININTTSYSSETTTNFILEEKLYVSQLQTKMKENLISEVEKYIKKTAPESKLNSEFLVNKCLEYNVDITFVLSQALLESHLGTKGKARSTNSVWNVGTYDNGKILYRYKHPDESVEPYLKLINENYLTYINSFGDTIYKDIGHLIEDKGYTNYYGARFASAREYEKGMRRIMVKINMETSISFYQDILNLSEKEIIAYFRPRDERDLYALN